MYSDYRDNDENVKDYQSHEQIIQIIKRQFTSYGYKRIKTSAFEKYDLYSTVNSSINQTDMIKVIDQAGEVLVLRPDVTIPITQQLAEESTKLVSERRYFYVQDVFRQPLDYRESIESTQAGVEYFGESSPQADAEVIVLACQTLEKLGFKDVKIEIGDAGFFQELIETIDLSTNELNELKNMIQAKNGIDIRPFLQQLSVDEHIVEAIEKIPFLYGGPLEVTKRAKEMLLTDKMNEKIDYLMQVYNILKMYGLERNIVMDLGLINQMGYYSDIIFQGFVEDVGKPVLTGGRYDQLANKFQATIPAIGFAYEVDTLVKAISEKEESSPIPIDIEVNYAPDLIEESIELAKELRAQKYSVISLPSGKQSGQESIYKITLDKNAYNIHYKGKSSQYSNLNGLLQAVKGGF